jgi:hypothetical protein
MAMPKSLRCLLLLGAAVMVVATPAHPVALHGRDTTTCSTTLSQATGIAASGGPTLSVGSLLDKGIAALGGKDAIMNLKGVSAHA